MIVSELGLDRSDTRLSEAHHRIANNLALIAGFVRLQSSKISKDQRTLSAADVCMLLQEVGVRIETVGRLHHLLGTRTTGGLVDLGDYLEATCGVLAQSVCAGRGVKLKCETSSCQIAPERAGLVGLIVAELVTNSVKYAHPGGAPGEINVTCDSGLGGLLTFGVDDDGVGLPEGFDPMVDGGLGMRVIRSLVRQLEGEIDFQSDGLGLAAKVTMQILDAVGVPPFATVN
jgi:two-component sensor histidine kinase